MVVIIIKRWNRCAGMFLKAQMYEETYKDIMFLKSQICMLESMLVASCSSSLNMFMKAQIGVLESMHVTCCSSSLNLRSGNPRYKIWG
ncbi:hypothetical protein HanIR_Chr03g0102541 [Helianthus annuus]|nr:hypothetical protein HanIR_Chr03g0102541 [Helianthus annuus]